LYVYLISNNGVQKTGCFTCMMQPPITVASSKHGEVFKKLVKYNAIITCFATSKAALDSKLMAANCPPFIQRKKCVLLVIFYILSNI
jgi:hypothetical protein